MPPIMLSYYRNLGSLRYGNKYCVEFDVVWEKLSFSSSTEAYLNHAVITARRLVHEILKNEPMHGVWANGYTQGWLALV